MTRALSAWGPAVAWAAALFLLSEWRPSGGTPDVPGIDKAAHFLLYGVLGAALHRGGTQGPVRIEVPILLAVGAAYGAADEWHQAFVPGRNPSVFDWMTDVAGVTAGLWVASRRAPSAAAAPSAADAPSDADADTVR